MNRIELLRAEGHRLDLEIARLMVEIEQMIAMAKFKRNSSYFMRKEGNPLIIKREGYSRATILKHIIRCAEQLDEVRRKECNPWQ